MNNLSSKIAGTTKRTKTEISETRDIIPSWLAFGSFFRHFFTQIFFNPLIVGFSIILPVFMYFMFGTGKSHSTEWVGNANVAAAILVNMTLYSTCVTNSSIGANVTLERVSRVNRLYAITPTSSVCLLFARILSGISVTALVNALVFAIGWLTDAKMNPETWTFSYLIIVGVSILPFTIGVAFAFLIRNEGAFSAVSCVIVISAFASGMFIPLSQMGDFIANIAPFTPFYGMVKISSGVIYGWQDFTFGWIANYLGWLIFFIMIAISAQKRDTGR